MKYTGETYTGWITKENIGKNGVFVYGDNTSFFRGAGNAVAALKYFGAIQGIGGYVGQSFGLVTTDLSNYKRGKEISKSVSDEFLLGEIKKLYELMETLPNKKFFVGYTGLNTMNLSGFSNQEFADMFSEFSIPKNAIFEEEFSTLLLRNK